MLLTQMQIDAAGFCFLRAQGCGAVSRDQLPTVLKAA
jgi:hypothetical protein